MAQLSADFFFPSLLFASAPTKEIWYLNLKDENGWKEQVKMMKH